MKTNAIRVLIPPLFALCACTAQQGKYEKAIAEYVQTDKHGTRVDLQFKVLSIQESPCTVADSIEIFRADLEKEQAVAIEGAKKNMAYWQGILADNPGSRDAERYKENIESIQQRIDSLSNLRMEEAGIYTGLPATEVLAMFVTCRYSYVMPTETTRQERTETFVLSPDGETVMGKTVNSVNRMK